MRIAVVGSGVAGLTTAWLLHRHHQVTLFEKASRIGGHSNTVDIVTGGRTIPVDTGFIVYNDANYPNFRKLLQHLDVETEASDMSFSVSLDDGRFEYCGASLRTLLAQPANLMKPEFWSLISEIVRFNMLGRKHASQTHNIEECLAGFLRRHRFSNLFQDRYLLPMAAAIWSAPTRAILDFPAATLLRFFDNHALLGATGHRQWRTLKNRSRDYVDRLADQLGNNVRRASQIIAARRTAGHVELIDSGGHRQQFDQLVLACHADRARALLLDADDCERHLLGAFDSHPNTAVLHSDPTLMPKRKDAWASWNYLGAVSPDRAEDVCVTYWLNRLQNIDTRFPLFITLNPRSQPNPDLVHGSFRYRHPVFDRRALSAQKLMPQIQGRQRIWFAGAWLRNGFHEDGVTSALTVAAGLGVSPPWAGKVEAAGAAFAIPERAAALPA